MRATTIAQCPIAFGCPFGVDEGNQVADAQGAEGGGDMVMRYETDHFEKPFGPVSVSLLKWRRSASMAPGGAWRDWRSATRAGRCGETGLRNPRLSDFCSFCDSLIGSMVRSPGRCRLVKAVKSVEAACIDAALRRWHAGDSDAMDQPANDASRG